MSREFIKGAPVRKKKKKTTPAEAISFFKLSELKAGMLVFLNNDMRLLVFEREDGKKFFQGAPGWMNSTQYDDSLHCKELSGNEYDIKTIYSLPSCPYGDINDIFEKPEKSRKILWEREKENEEA